MEEAGPQLLVEAVVQDAHLSVQDAHGLLLNVFPALTLPPNEPLGSKLAAGLTEECRLQHKHGRLDFGIHQLWLMLVLIGATFSKQHQQCYCLLASLCHMQKARGRPSRHLKTVVDLAEQVGWLECMQCCTGPAFRLTKKGRAAAEGFRKQERLLARSYRIMKEARADESIAKDLKELQLPLAEGQVDPLYEKDWLRRLLSVTLNDIEELESSDYVTTCAILDTMTGMGPMASLLLQGPCADSQASEDKQQQYLDQMFKQLRQSPLRKYVMTKNLSSSLVVKNSKLSEPKPNDQDLSDEQQLVYRLSGSGPDTDSDKHTNSLLLIAEHLDCISSEDNSSASNETHASASAGSARASADAASDQHGANSKESSKQQLPLRLLSGLNQLSVSSSISSIKQAPAKLQDFVGMVESWRFPDRVQVVFYGSQVSRAAAVALPVNAMLLGVSGSTQGIVSDRGVSLREQVPQLQYLHSLGNHCSDDWADLIEAQFTYNEFNEYSPTAEVILPISGADSKAVHLHITIGEVPGALYETAFVTEQLRSVKLRRAVHVTQLVVKESKGAYWLTGDDIPPHAVVYMLLADIIKQGDLEWWGVDVTIKVNEGKITYKELQHMLHSMDAPDLQVEEALVFWAKLPAIWQRLSQVAEQECLVYAGSSVTTLAAATTEAMNSLKMSGDKLKSSSNLHPAVRKQALADHQQAYAAVRTYSRIKIDDPAYDVLRLILGHAAERANDFFCQYNSDKPMQDRDASHADRSDQLDSASISADLLAALVSNNAGLHCYSVQQHLESKKGQGVLVWGAPVQDLAQRYALPTAKGAAAAAARKDHLFVSSNIRVAGIQMSDVVRQAAAAGNAGLLAVSSSVQQLSTDCQQCVSTVDGNIQQLKKHLGRRRGDAHIKALERKKDAAVDDRYLLQEEQRSYGLLQARIQKAVLCQLKQPAPAVPAVAAAPADVHGRLNKMMVEAWSLVKLQLPTQSQATQH